MADETKPTTEVLLNKQGNRRGMSTKKNRSTQLLEQMQLEIESKYGIKDFDPVVMLAMIGVEASRDTVKVDYKGNPEYELDDDGHPKRHVVTGDPIPIIIHADRTLATAAFAKAAPYVRSTLKQIELSDGSDGHIDADVIGAKEKLAHMAGIVLDAVITEAIEEDEENEDD